MGLVGAGKMGLHHARALARIPNSGELTAVADPSSEAQAKVKEIWPGVRAFDSIEDLIASGSTDIVHICTSPATHDRFARAALEGGQHLYVEKPFVDTTDQAESILQMANDRGLSVCAGHQLLFERPTIEALSLLPMLRDVVHIESYFSFKTVRRAPGGRAPLAPQLQLLDILPHPVYLLLRFLDAAVGEGSAEISTVEVGPAGTVHAQVKKGGVTANLVVSLDARPIESYLKVVGTNGSVVADYVRGTTGRAIGPGVSGIDKALNPYRTASQLAWGTTKALSVRVLKRQRSYPGLAEIFGAFHDSIRAGTPSPTPPDSIRDTVAICEKVAASLVRRPEHSTGQPIAEHPSGSAVLVTGGTGFLGRPLVTELSRLGVNVRVVARRQPAPWEAVPGVEYVKGDLATGLHSEALDGVETVIHCAAETAGGWEDHERNSIDATEKLIRAASEAGIDRFIQVSSIAVLAQERGSSVSERSPLHKDPRSAGAYTWGKLVSEQRAIELGEELGLRVKVWRPAALIDLERFEPPGKLGKRAGNLFVAVGGRREPIGASDVGYCARMLAWAALDFDGSPEILNILPPVMPSRGELVEELRKTSPDLTVVWLPRLLLGPLSLFAVVLQKVLRPGKAAVSVAKVFARQRYDNAEAARVAAPATEYIEAVEKKAGSRSIAPASSVS